jgi:hypothetical protein
VPLETSAALLEFLQDFLSERPRLTPENPPPIQSVTTPRPYYLACGPRSYAGSSG